MTRIHTIYTLLATGLAVALFVGLRLAHAILLPSSSYSIPWGWLAHWILESIPYLIAYAAVGATLARITFPEHKRCGWIAGVLTVLTLVLLFGNPKGLDMTDDVFFKIRIYLDIYTRIVVALPVFVFASWLAGRMHRREPNREQS